ncbi:MAG: L,D-transpeptidase [Verrucomicrobia bacterium]|nr:L,D-transpeptidase [Verrucomicrobiota bacterium]
MTRFLPDLLLACRFRGIRPTRFSLLVNIAEQRTSLFEKSSVSPRLRGFNFIKQFRCSTSKFGIGQVNGSNCTPLGLHRIARKIGGGWPVGTVFKSRRPVGFTWQGMPLAPITTRILWLEGLEPGFNRGGRVDTFARYIYIHGTGDEPTLGRPASHGCIHLAADDLIPLYDKLPVGTLVWIAER